MYYMIINSKVMIPLFFYPYLTRLVPEARGNLRIQGLVDPWGGCFQEMVGRSSGKTMENHH